MCLKFDFLFFRGVKFLEEKKKRSSLHNFNSKKKKKLFNLQGRSANSSSDYGIYSHFLNLVVLLVEGGLEST